MQKPKFELKLEKYNPRVAFGWLAFASFLMTIFTAYQLINILPDPRIFYFGQLAAASILFCILLVLIVRWLSGITWRFTVGLSIGLMLFCAVLTPFTIFASWTFGTIYFSFLRAIPVLVFPILVVLFAILAYFASRLGESFKPREMKILVGLILAFSCIYLWGHSATFEGAYYDEGKDIGGKSYHSIVYYGLMGEPGFIQMYECQTAIFGCGKIYESFRDNYTVDDTVLIHDEAAGHLRLEYHQAGEDPELLFDYVLP
jgi:hypothetical protein